MSGVGSGEVEAIFRTEAGSVIASLSRRFRSIDLAEEAVQDAFEIALRRWPGDGLPPNPGAWIATTARNRAINVLRRESSRSERQRSAMFLQVPGDEEQQEPFGEPLRGRAGGLRAAADDLDLALSYTPRAVSCARALCAGR